MVNTDLRTHLRKEANKINAQSQSKRPKSVKLDYFLYSCFEFETTIKATPTRSTGAERWPEIVKHIEGEDNNIKGIGDLRAQFKSCLDWYVDKFPYLLTENHLDLTNINGIIPAVVFIGLDFKTLVNIDDNHQELVFSKVKPNPTLWNLIEDCLGEVVPKFQVQILAYLQWAFGEKEEKQWDIGSRPPVGKYAPNLRRGKGSFNTRDKGNDKPNRRGGNRGSGNDRRGGTEKRSSVNREKTALLDVNNAVKKLKKDDSVNEVVLNPTNSFYRRLQHKHAISQGFESISRGEGNDRSVVVRRAKDEA